MRNFYLLLFVLFARGVYSQEKPLPIKPYATYNPMFETGNLGDLENGQSLLAPDGSVYVISQTRTSTIVVKVDETLGTTQWSHNFPASGGNRGAARPFLSPNGNINFVFLNFNWNVIDFDPGPGTANFTTRYDLMWLQFTPAGTLNFARKLTENIVSDYVYNITGSVDAAGNLYIFSTLYANASKDFDPGPGQRIFTASGSDLLVLARYNQDGTLAWAKQWPYRLNQNLAGAIKIEGSHFYCAFSTSTTVNVDPDGSQQLTGSGVVIAKYTLNGTFVKAVKVTSATNYLQVGDYVFSSNGDILITHFEFGSGAGKAYVSRYTNTMDLINQAQIAQIPSMTVGALAINPTSGDVFIGGWVGPHTMQLFSKGFPTGNSFNVNGNRGYVLQFASDYTLKGSYFYGETGVNNQNETTQIAFNKAGKLAVFGRYQSTVDLDPSPLTEVRLDANPSYSPSSWFGAYYCETLPAPVAGGWSNYVKQGAKNVILEVAPDANATGYTWSLPAGFTLVGGGTTNKITVDIGAAAITGAVSVTADNTCGRGLPYIQSINVGTVDAATIVTPATIVKSYGDKSLILQATTNASTPVTFSEFFDTDNVITIVNNIVKINKAGTARIIARTSGDAAVGAGVKEITLTVQKRPLKVVAKNATKQLGDENPPLTFNYNETTPLKGHALNFDGVNDIVTVSAPAQLKTRQSEFTVEAWVNLPDNGGEHKIVGNMHGTGGFILGLTDGGQLFPEIRTPSGSVYFLKAGNVPSNTWTHIAFTYKSGGQLIAYINGLAVGNLNVGTDLMGDSPYAVAIGEYYGFKKPGTIDELRIWTKARTGAEILRDMNTQISSLDDKLVVYYTFEQGVASGGNSGLTVLLDEKGNHANLSNFALAGATSNWVEGKVVPPLAINTAPTVSTLATKDSPLGTYAISVGGGTDDNYEFEYVEGLLTVTKKLATVAVDSKTVDYTGSAQSLAITTNPSGLPVTITYNGNSDGPVLPGVYEVEAVVNHSEYQGVGTGTLTIKKLSAVVTLSSLERVYNGEEVAVGVSTVPAGLQTLVTYNGNSKKPVNPGTYTIVSTVQESLYEGTATGTLTIGKRPQVLSSSAVKESWFVGESITIEASSSSGLPVTVQSSNTAVVKVSGKGLTFQSEGTAEIKVVQAGTQFDEPAEKLLQTVTVKKRPQELTSSDVKESWFVGESITIEASSSLGLPVSVQSSNVNVATVSGKEITFVSEGTAEIKITQAGTQSAQPAERILQTVQVTRRLQSISFADPGSQSLEEGSFQVVATSNSGLGVQLKADPADRVRITNTTITPLVAGKVRLTASQVGNSMYAPAVDVSYEICILPIQPEIVVSEAESGAPLLTSGSASNNQWLLNGTAIAGATAPTYRVDRAGNYQVRVDVEGCQVLSEQKLMIVTGLEEKRTSTWLYPNPVQEKLVLQVGSEEASFRIVNSQGAMVYEGRGSNEVHVDVASWGAGVYTVILQSGRGVETVKFLKR